MKFFKYVFGFYVNVLFSLPKNNNVETSHDIFRRRSNEMSLKEINYGSEVSVKTLLSKDQDFVPIENSNATITLLSSVVINTTEIKKHKMYLSNRLRFLFQRFRIVVCKIIVLRRMLHLFGEVRFRRNNTEGIDNVAINGYHMNDPNGINGLATRALASAGRAMKTMAPKL